MEGEINKPWYNLIIPRETSLDCKHINSHFNKDNNYSLYLDLNQKENSKSLIKKHDLKNYGEDTYIYECLDSKKHKNTSGDINLIKNQYNEYLKIAKTCFQDWDEILDYSKLFFNKDVSTLSNTIYR